MTATDAGKKQIDFLIRYTLQSAATIVLVAVLVRVFFVSSYVMSGSSMLPSVWPGDFLVAAKWNVGEPRRGEIVALRCPGGKDRTCLKRVVAVPGDRVELNGGILFVNGEAGVQKKVSEELAVERFSGRGWVIWPSSKGSQRVDPMVVPPRHVYLLNDKRADGEDSRGWGTVSLDELEARVKYVWLSLDWYEKDGAVRSWPRIRWPRMLRSID